MNQENRAVAEEALSQALGGADDARVRRMSSLLLGGTGSATATGPLLEALRDPDMGVRSAAAQALARIGTQALTVLIPTLRDPDWRIRYRAAEALGEIGDPRAVSPLIRSLSDEKDHVRYMSAKALGQIGDPAAIDALSRTLHDQNPPARKAAALALGRIGGAEAALEAALESEPSGSVRRGIRDALGRP
ncbi:HEAT repeat domain-containing protein [Methanofollis fontis]|uniref:PBS lyase n=1 Tax=Methanofollis fontis TaxID=2052832 RepID=A0A483CVX9_9EURY|nr:HEAT repeat domain-containing protein [Methanofollis fontis]TAJ43675.1 PBS lyase [Methanofollis fontis]